MIVTRFAPSPTGFLHLGHAYAALFGCEQAKAVGGRFLLRIEDIDSTRCRLEFEEAIFEDLAWLGVAWEEPVRRQSEHFADYARALDRLDSLGVVYPCFCTRKEIEAEIARAASAPHGPEGALYPGTCRGLSQDARARRMGEGRAYALRLDTAKAAAIAGPLRFEERGVGPGGEAGEQIARPELAGDIVLARKELPSSYHLAAVADDGLQGVTLVTRGNDLFFATHIQRLIQALLGIAPPAYAHHRLILDAQGRKFSKRNGGVMLQQLRREGMTPEDIRRIVGIAGPG